MPKQQKRKRFLITASIKGVERAEAILKRRGVSSISAFAKAQFLGKSSVNKFLSRQPIQADTFIKICEGLEIKDWKELAELEPVLAQVEKVTQSQQLQGCVAQDSREVGESFRRATVISPIGEVKIEFKFKGSIETVTADIQSMMELSMKNSGGETIHITDVRSGCIKVTVQGSPRDIAKLIDQINSEELTEVEGFPIQDCQILSEDFLPDVGLHSNSEKWQLIDDIINNPKIARQLSGADLSDADLSLAILMGADLTNADLSGTDLSGANLSAPSGSHLSAPSGSQSLSSQLYIPLISLFLLPFTGPIIPLTLRALERKRRENAAGASSSGAILPARSANLEGANLTDTIVEGCLFGEGIGLSAIQKEFLKRRGGLFDDAPGDRSEVETPSPNRR